MDALERKITVYTSCIRSAIIQAFFHGLQIFLEQKKMLKTGLNIAHFKQHVQVIEAETIEYFERWGDSGEKSKIPHKSLDYSMSVRKTTTHCI